MRFRVAPSIRIVAALGLLAAAKVEAASIYRAVDFGANASNLVLNNVGQVAGLDYSNGNSPGFLYDDRTGQKTPLAAGVTPISLTDAGRVIDARGPFDYYRGGNTYGDEVGVGAPTAGNHLGQLVGTASYTPWGVEGGIPSVPFPYLYFSGSAGSPLNPQYLDDLQTNFGYPYTNRLPQPSDPAGRGSYGSPDTANIHPTGINDSGQIVGNRLPGDPVLNNSSGEVPRPYHSHAFLGYQDLGTLGGTNSSATAINNAGQVTGQADTAGGSSHAFLYTGGKMVDLGLLPGATSSEGLGLNDKGDVVGTSGGHAFLFSNGIMQDLNDRLPATLGLILDKAIAINDAGQILAYGEDAKGVEHGLLLSPVPAPEPTTLALLGLATAGYAVRLRRKSATRSQTHPAVD